MNIGHMNTGRDHGRHDDDIRTQLQKAAYFPEMPKFNRLSLWFGLKPFTPANFLSSQRPVRILNNAQSRIR